MGVLALVSISNCYIARSWTAGRCLAIPFNLVIHVDISAALQQSGFEGYVVNIYRKYLEGSYSFNFSCLKVLSGVPLHNTLFEVGSLRDGIHSIKKCSHVHVAVLKHWGVH